MLVVDWTGAEADLEERIRTGINGVRPEQVKEILAVCMANKCTVWHGAAVYFNTKCYCYDCNPNFV